MPTLPTTSDVHVNRPLTNMSVAFMQDLAKFKADQLAPIMPSDKKSDIYFTLDKSYWFSDVMRKRGIGAPVARGGYGVSQASFLLDLWSVGKPIDDQTRANEDTPLNSDRSAMKYVTRAERLNRELRFKDAFWNTGLWTTDMAGVNTGPTGNQFLQWDQATATPIDDIARFIQIIEKLTGMTPNVFACGAPVWHKLKTNAQILARLTGGAYNAAPATVTKQIVAGFFEVDEVVVMNAVYNTNTDDSSMVGDYIFGKQAFLGFRDPTVDVETATAMRTITWKQYAGNQNGTRILKWRDEPTHSDVVEIESAYVHKIIAPDLGVFMNTVVA